MSHGKGGPSHAPEFVAGLKAAGFDFFAGVPCSLLKGLVSLLDKDPEAHYVSATREDSAIGMAVDDTDFAGADLIQRKNRCARGTARAQQHNRRSVQ